LSQPRYEPPGPGGAAGREGYARRGRVNAWAAEKLDLTQADPPWENGDDDAGADWARPDPAPQPQGAGRPGPRLTARGAIAGMLVAFFLGLLLASWLHWGVLAGGSFLAGSVAAARYTKRADLLTVAVTPPLLFLCAVVAVRALTATGNTLLATAEGAVLTLASMAPWLFAGVILALIVAWRRGLRQCVADLRYELSPGRPARGPGQPARR
jgi:Domain of unknown function (DUF6542)